jgi:hypothetical protein
MDSPCEDHKSNVSQNNDLTDLKTGFESVNCCEFNFGEQICSIQGPTRCTFLCILYSSLFLALHVSGAICTHPQ